MSVRITDDLWWINECYPVDDRRHLHISVFLIAHDWSDDDDHSDSCNDGDLGDDYCEKSILVDTGSFYHSERIRDELEQTLGTATVDTVFLSNPDYVHSGNVSLFLDESEVICFVGTPERHGYSGAITADPGQDFEVGDRRFSFVDPIVSDIASSVWIYDHDSGSLFTSDGFGHYHTPGECDLVSDDFESGIRFEAMRDFHDDTLRWLQYVDPSAIERAVGTVFDAYDVRRILPAHGHPIVEPDVDAFVDDFDRAIRAIVDQC